MRRLVGDVDATNRRMLGLAGAIGFTIRPHPDGGHVRSIELALDRRAPLPLPPYEENDL